MKALRSLLVLSIVSGLLLAGATAASAHYCPDPDPRSSECTDTPPSQEWRDNYVPLFDAPDRREDSRTGYQRWRDERGCTSEFCVWADFSFSILPSDGDPGPAPSPNEVHVGAAGDHSLSEGAHQSEGHSCGPEYAPCEGIHDRHGGAAYADVCLAENRGGGGSVHDPDSCDDGMQDTEIGVVVVDKNPCGGLSFGVPVPCTDEYHIVRPFDAGYSERQRGQDQRDIESILADPERWVCGNENADKGQAC